MELVWLAGGAAMLVGIIMLLVRVPASRRWIAAGAVLLIGLAIAGVLALISLYELWSFGSIEARYALAAAVTAIASIVVAVLVVRRWPRRAVDAAG